MGTRRTQGGHCTSGCSDDRTSKMKGRDLPFPFLSSALPPSLPFFLDILFSLISLHLLKLTYSLLDFYYDIVKQFSFYLFSWLPLVLQPPSLLELSQPPLTSFLSHMSCCSPNTSYFPLMLFFLLPQFISIPT